MSEKRPQIRPYGAKGPYEWQKAAHAHVGEWLARENRAAETLVIKASRQVYGKSAFAKAELARFSLGIPGTKNAYVTPKLALARKMQKEMAKEYTPFIESSNLMDMVITFVNGSTVRFHSENQGDGLRGFTVTGIMVVDEGAFMRDATFYELLAPWASVHSALTVILSTPQFKMGFYYDLYMMGLGASNHTITTLDWVRDYNVPIPPEVEAKRTLMPARKWKSEYLGLFLEAEGSVFGNFGEVLTSSGNEKPNAVFLGLDFGTGSGKDYTVLTGFDELGNQLFIWAVNDMSPTQQVAEIAEICKQFTREAEDPYGRMTVESSIELFLAEKNSIGAIYIDQLIALGVPVTPFITTNDSKRELVEDLQVAIQCKSVGLLSDPTQNQELSFYESKVTPGTNKVTYNAPAGQHDDHVMACMLGWKAYSGGRSGQYDVIF